MTEDIDPRLKDSHGPAYATWMALAELLPGSATTDEMFAFQWFMLAHTKSANLDVVSETNINVFWQDLIPAVLVGEVPVDCFKLEFDPLEMPPGCATNAQGRWKSWCLYIEPNALLTHLQVWLARQRGNVVLRRKDLRDQLSKEEYWLSNVKKRFVPVGAGGVNGWGFLVDKHPLGYTAVPDETYNKYLMNVSEGDPRKGPLFDLAQYILDHQPKEEEAK